MSMHIGGLAMKGQMERNNLLTVLVNILLHDWEGNTGEYSVRGWQYWPDRKEGQYITRELNIPLYSPTQKEDLLYDWASI